MVVRTLFSTDDVPDAERYGYWQHMHREALAAEYVFPNGRHDWFRGHCAVTQVGAMRAAVLTCAGGPAPGVGEGRRTPGFTDQLDGYELKLAIACEEFAVTQDGRRADLRAGDFTLTDLARPSSATVVGRHRKKVVSITMPRALLPLPPAQVARLTAVPLPGQDGAAALASTLLRRVTADAGAYRPAEAAHISNALLDLVAAALAGRIATPAAVPPEVERTALLHRIYAYLHQRLGDPALTPRQIAAAHNISLRQLHKLFESEDCTVAEWIRRRRLDRCRRDLTDPALSNRPVGAIAARWGVRDPGHFSRLFRAAYGVPPGEYRTLYTPRHAPPRA
ncbi:helix-turn-helix domain-containing protein [Actinomadura sp. NPDC000600]|uniref:helix-turn-helix domain-containing protein n=1 Tax=Actinomadura sp. NPDC000600 TaxID=3154262 RepID=UPI0033974C4A